MVIHNCDTKKTAAMSEALCRRHSNVRQVFENLVYSERCARVRVAIQDWLADW